MRIYARFLLQPPGGGCQPAPRQRPVAVLPLRSAQQCTNVLFFSDFIDTMPKSGFPNLKKRHLSGQRRVAVLSIKPVPVPTILPVSISNCVRILCSYLAVIGQRAANDQTATVGDARPLSGAGVAGSCSEIRSLPTQFRFNRLDNPLLEQHAVLGGAQLYRLAQLRRHADVQVHQVRLSCVACSRRMHRKQQRHRRMLFSV